MSYFRLDWLQNTVQIWDTAGLERFRTITNAFCEPHPIAPLLGRRVQVALCAPLTGSFSP